MSIAWYSAWRTRLSLNGFLPLTFEYSSSSRAWSMPMKTMRFSRPSSTLHAGCLRLSLGTSCAGGSSTKSISPEISAAMRVRVGLDRRVDDLVDVAVEAACLDAPPVRVLLEHASSRPARATPACTGPVPLALRAVIMSSFLL